MKIAILGYGDQGRAAFEYWTKPDNQITICDASTSIAVPEGIPTQLGTSYLNNLNEYDLLIRSPGIHPSDIVAANPSAPQILSKVTTVTNEFFKVCPSRNIIGVTGSKGKGTTSTLITEFLKAAGKTTHLGANIGIPPLDMLKAGIEPEDWVVLELANFQLIDLKASPTIGVCVMVVPEHLNWHADMDEYIKAKQQMFAYQTADDTLVFNRVNEHSKQVVSVSRANNKLSYEVPTPGAQPQATTGAYVKDESIFMGGVEICKTSDVALMGRHNLENVCAAVAATWDLIDKRPEIVKEVVTSFTGLEHRLQKIAEVNGVSYYDDSFGTTPETAIVALQALPHAQPKIIILGGADKEATYESLAQVVVSSNVRAAVLIGEMAGRIETALKQAGFDHSIAGGNNMTSIVQAAQTQAQPGDVVLLSPACASFGLFQNYKDRGEQFQTAVKLLAGGSVGSPLSAPAATPLLDRPFDE